MNHIPVNPASITLEIKKQLLKYARKSIQSGLDHGQSLFIDKSKITGTYSHWAATFVTLHKNHELRGCIGRLEAVRSLTEDIVENAYASAFNDYRFPTLMDDELPEVDISISILSAPEPMNVANEKDLLEQLKPGIDGLILKDRFSRSTFLPSVWDQLTTPENFLRELKKKAGLSAFHWSKTICFERYTTLGFSEQDV